MVRLLIFVSAMGYVQASRRTVLPGFRAEPRAEFAIVAIRHHCFPPSRLPACGAARHPGENVTVLVDDKATLESIRREISSLVATTAADETVAILFSCHGARIGQEAGATSALVPYDCLVADLVGTTLGEVELSAALLHLIGSACAAITPA